MLNKNLHYYYYVNSHTLYDYMHMKLCAWILETVTQCVKTDADACSCKHMHVYTQAKRLFIATIVPNQFFLETNLFLLISVGHFYLFPQNLFSLF